MTPAPQPLRCETCNREHTDHLCNYRKVRLAERDKEFLEVVGCASHSSESQKGRDGEKVEPSSASSDVLDEFIMKLLEWRHSMSKDCTIHEVWVSEDAYLKSALPIAKLRSQQTKEQE